MRSLLFIGILSLLNILLPAQAGAAGAKTFMVVAFSNDSGRESQEYLSVGLASVLTERLARTGFSVVLSPLSEPVLLGHGQDMPGKLDEANELAKRRGANYLISGAYTGHPEKWDLAVRVYEVTPQGAIMRGEGEKKGVNQMVRRRKKNGKLAPPTVSGEVIHETLASATGDALWTAFRPQGAGMEDLDKLKKAIAIPDTRDSYAFIVWSRGVDFWLDHDFEPAAKEARHATNIDPTFVDAKLLHAASLARAGNRRKAMEQYEEVLKRQQKNLRALLGFGRAALDEGDTQSAIAAYRKAATIAPKMAEVRYLLGVAYVRSGEAAKAMEAFIAARDLDPKHVDSRHALGNLLANAGSFAKAAIEYAAVLALEPHRLEAAYSYAAILRASGRFEEAVAAYLDAARNHPKEAALHKFRGDVLRALGRKDEALQAYRTAHKITPGDARLAEILSGAPASVLGGKEFLAVIGKGKRYADDADLFRREFRLAANDIVETVNLSRAKDCPATVPPAHMRAKVSMEKFAEAQASLGAAVTLLKRAERNGERLALTPIEATVMDAVLVAEQPTRRDIGEIAAQYNTAVTIAMTSKGCAPGQPTAIADAAKLRERNERREVELVQAPPPKSYLPITPRITASPSRNVRIFIDNGKAHPESVFIDEGYVGYVPAASRGTFVVSIGWHTICTVPAGGRQCTARDQRHVFADDGLTFVLKSGN